MICSSVDKDFGRFNVDIRIPEPKTQTLRKD